MTRRTAVKDWSDDEGSEETAEEDQRVRASPPDDDRRSRLRSGKRPAPAQSAPRTSSEVDLQPLSQLRSHTRQGSALRRNTSTSKGDTRSRRSSRRLSSAHGGKVAGVSNAVSEEKAASARRQISRRTSEAAAEQGVQSQTQERTAAGNRTGRTTRAASRSNRARPKEQEHQPARPLRSRARAATRARAAAPQHNGSPEDSNDEVSEPQPLHQRSVRASRQIRKASKLVQGGGNISDDDYSSSDLDNFLAPSDDDAEEEAPSQGATNVDELDAETDRPGPAATPDDSPRQTLGRLPGTATMRRLRKAQAAEDMAAHAEVMAEALEDSEPPQHAPDAHKPGQRSDAGYRRYTPEEKGKQKAVEEAGPSGLHVAMTPAPAAQQQSEANYTPGLSSGGRPAPKRRRLQKADGQTVKAEADITIASRVTRSGRIRKERPDYKALWEQKTARAKLGKPADWLAETEDDSGLSLEDDDAAEPVIIDSDDEEYESADGQVSKGAHFQGKEVSGSEDVHDFIDEDGQEEVDDGRPLQSPLQLAGLFDNRPDVDNCFNFYLDYLLECIADPEFAEVIRGDPRARQHYNYAIHKVEIDELARWRETYTKSDAWKRAIPGFITALERLPGCSVQPREAGLGSQNRRYSSGLADEDFEGVVRECAACTRKHTRAAMQLVLKGKLGDPGYIKGAKRLRDMAIRDDDEGESGSDRESILDAEDGDFKERVYDVGSHCASRVHLYHSLWHYKRRLRCQLKKELKAARLFLEGCGQPCSKAECVKRVKANEGLYDRLRSNFKQLGQMAREYATMQASGGFRSASGTLDRVTKKVSQLMYRLNDDSDADSGSKPQSDTDDESEVVMDGGEEGLCELLADNPKEAALPRSASGDAHRRLVLGDSDSDDDSDAGNADEAEDDATRAQGSPAASALPDDDSEGSAAQAGAAASARHKAGQVIVSSSEDEQQTAACEGKHASAAGKQQPRYRKPAGQPRYVPPAKRQSGRRAEDALKLAAASFQASPSRVAQPAPSPAATPEPQTAPGTPEHSSSPSKRAQPYFMASLGSRREGPLKHHAEASRLGSHSAGIGTDLGALLRQAQGSGSLQRLTSLALPGRRADSPQGAKANDEGVDLTTENSGPLTGASGENAVQEMALAAAAASREALAALSYPDDSPQSPGSPGTRTTAQQRFQQSADQDALEVDVSEFAEQAADDVDSARYRAEHLAGPTTAMDHVLPPAQSDRQRAPAQKASMPQSGMSSRMSTLRQLKGGIPGSKGNVDIRKSVSKVPRTPDCVLGQKGILKYFSPRSKG